MKPCILNAEPEDYCEEARAILSGFADVSEISLTRSDLLSTIEKYDALIVRLGHRIDCEMLDRAERLKAIATATTGLSHIDIDEAMKRNISIICLKGERSFLDTIASTAEHTWGLLLSLIRKIPSASRHVKHGGWDRNLFKGAELAGKRLGIIGFGRLGSMVAQYGYAFKMEVLVYDPLVRSEIGGVEYVDLYEMLSKSDIVSVHVPLENTTRYLIGERELASMKPGCYLLNTSRGEVIDEGALLKALETGHLAGAALDVLSGENSGNSEWLTHDPLIQYSNGHDNLIITPHIGGATVDSMRKTEIFIANKLRDYFVS